MTWHYAAVKQTQGEDSWWGIKEIYPDESGQVNGYTLDDMAPHGETLEELIEDLTMMLEDAKTRQRYEIMDHQLLNWEGS